MAIWDTANNNNSEGGSGSGMNVPSEQIFNSTSDRDTFFSSNPSKLVNGAQCVVLTNPPSGLYQVYTSGAWQDRTAVVVGPKGDAGDPSILIDDTSPKDNRAYSSEKVESLIGESSGLPDNGIIYNLSTPFTEYFDTAAEGKFYLDGWNEASGLPVDIEPDERVFVVTNFSGYDDVANGARVQFSSHFYGIYEATKSSGVWSELIRLDNPVLTGFEGELLKSDGSGGLVPSGVVSKKDGSLSLSSGSVDIGPHTISSAVEGVEATNDSTGESYSFVFSGQGDDCGPVDRVLGDESSIKTTEDLSLQLTNHISKLTATADVRIIKQPITIKPVSPQTNVTMQITDLNGSDLWTHGPFDMTIDGSGNFDFTISSVIDFKVGEYLVTFTSIDGDVALFGGVSLVSGEQIVYADLPFKPFHDETLHNIKNDGGIIRTIAVDPNSNLTSTITSDGELILSDKVTPPGSTVDIAFWWSDNSEPDADDILNAMSQEQTATVISHTDGFSIGSLQSKTMTAKRDESSLKYAFFAWPSGFFSPEPTLVDTGFGGPSTWIQTTRIVDGVTYNILTVEITNISTALEEYSLIQEGVK